MTHQVLVGRAVRWLSGTMRCNPVLSGIASAGEVPDAIGWSSRWSRSGSIVVECKTSMSDFLRDKNKGVKHWMAEEEKVKARKNPRIGRFRYFLTPLNLVGLPQLEKHYPNHGLLFYDGRRVLVIKEAQAIDDSDLYSEVRLLRFALIHVHENLTRKGCTVNMCELTKHWAAQRNGIIFPEQQ